MNRRGSQLIQAVMMLAIFSAAVVAFLSIRGLSTGKGVITQHRAIEKAHLVKTALRLACDKYMYGMTLTRNPATELGRMREEFPDEPSLSVLASIPKDAAPFTKTDPVPVIVSIALGEERLVLKVDVYGTPGMSASGSEQIYVKECLPDHFTRRCRSDLAEVVQSNEYFESKGLNVLSTVGSCLLHSYEKYGIQHCIEPNMTAAQILNYCRILVDSTATLPQAERDAISVFCGLKLRDVVNRIPDWGSGAANCIANPTEACNLSCAS